MNWTTGMEKSVFKMMYFSMGRSSVKQVSMNKIKLGITFVFFIIFFTALISLSLKLFTGFYQNWKITFLEQKAEGLDSRLAQKGRAPACRGQDRPVR